MAERDKILKYFKGTGDEELAAKLIDLAERANRSNTFRVTEFLDPHEQNTAKIVAANFPDIELVTDGGFPHAERVKAAFVSDGFHGVPDFGIAAYLVSWDKRYYNLGHRDVLGAFMGMGCRREILGDIVLVPEGAQLVVDKTFSNYLESNLTEIGAANVTVTPLERSELKVREEKVKEIHATVAALRLDAVAAAGYGTSRSRMTEEIKSQNVKINWKEAKNAAQAVEEGDVLSFRGRGRVELAEVRGTTKKGRFSITLKRYI
jgi:RNA-binding protein YlmH